MFLWVLHTPILCAQKQWVTMFVASLYRHRCCLCDQQHTHTSPLWVSEKLLPKIAELLALGFGTRHTCLLFLSSFWFLILNVAITARNDLNLTFLSRKNGSFAWLIRIFLIGFFSFFLSGCLILINPSLRSIVRSKSIAQNLVLGRTGRTRQDSWRPGHSSGDAYLLAATRWWRSFRSRNLHPD